MFIFELLLVQSWSEPPLRRRMVAHTQKPEIDTNYCRGTMWYQDVRMGDFKDGQLELTSNGAKFGEKFISRSSTTCTLRSISGSECSEFCKSLRVDTGLLRLFLKTW